jgi:hypothetical protein
VTEDGGGSADSAIETYLDALLTASSAMAPRQRRNLLAETEAHLRDDAEAGVRLGLPVDEAEEQAVARFGPAAEIAGADGHRHGTALGALFSQLLASGFVLGAVGAVAVGASGLIAEVIRLFGGSRALVDVSSGPALTASGCARWLAIDPGARSCADAALHDWADETVAYRIALGALGVLALVLARWLARRHPRPLLSPIVSNTVATTLFAIAGCWTLGLGLDAVVVSAGHGSGQWLSAAPVALAAATVFGWRLIRELGSSSV